MDKKRLDEFSGRLGDLFMWQDRTKAAWIGCRFHLDGVLGDTQTYNIENLIQGVIYQTVIPPYFMYHETWRRSDLWNPFEIDWFTFNKDHGAAIASLEEIISIMDEQSEMWGVDVNSSFHGVFILFNSYIESLKRFYSLIAGGIVKPLWNGVGSTDQLILEYAEGLPKDWGAMTSDLFI